MLFIKTQTHTHAHTLKSILSKIIFFKFLFEQDFRWFIANRKTKWDVNYITPFPRNVSLGRLWLTRCMSVKWSWCQIDVVISVVGIFFSIEYALYVAWHTKKSWAFIDLVAAISATLHKTVVRSKYANSVSQFLLYWLQIICCIYKDFVQQLKAFLPSLFHLCACEMFPGWGHLITWMDPSVGHLSSILARLGGIWTIIFKKGKCPGGCLGGRGGGRCWSFDLTDTSIHLYIYSPEKV